MLLDLAPPALDAILNGIIFSLEKLDKILAFDYGIKEGVAEMKKMRKALEPGGELLGGGLVDLWLRAGVVGGIPERAGPGPLPMRIPAVEAP